MVRENKDKLDVPYTVFSLCPLRQCPAISHLFASLSHRHMLELSCHVAFGEL